ncbi:MuDR family transposase [Hibiscus syriacus]|uniref:MuDR family transposase n=1 Tax=Hibiscus syriacus TaxID=106335 RepID=A0A6A2WYS0_HIBSY|nr:MuDR family transposase [Hibiscus syriacus]
MSQCSTWPTKSAAFPRFFTSRSCVTFHHCSPHTKNKKPSYAGCSLILRKNMAFADSAVEYAVEVGTSVFFDSGPRGKSLLSGTVEERKAHRHFLRMSDVLLLTADELLRWIFLKVLVIDPDGMPATMEVESLTVIADPILAGQELLKKGNRDKWVVVKMGSKGSILITKSGIICAPAFKVKIMDTDGCGDSFVAAIAFGFIHDIPLVTTLAFANAVGGATAMGCGAGRNVATLKKVVELIETPDLNEDVKF